MRCVLALAFAGLGGCVPIFGLDEPVTSGDDGADLTPDARITVGCPSKYTITLPSPRTRYRVLEEQATFEHHEATCRQDAPGATHLVAFESASEAQYLRETLLQQWPGLGGRIYVGAAQPANQLRPDEGWTIATGGKVPAELWGLDQPIDGPSSHYFEDNEANVAELTLDGSSGLLFDASGLVLQAAICECEQPSGP